MATSQEFHSVRTGTHVSVRTTKKLVGTLGGVVELPDRKFGAITAGHVVLMARGGELLAETATSRMPIGRPVANAAGGHMLLVNESTDLAVIGPVEGDVTAISAEPRPIRDPTHEDRNHCVWVHLARDLAPVGAFVHEVDVSARVFRTDGPGEIVMYGLVTIDPVTRPGDSGAPVLDENETLIGFVVSGDGVRTYVLPAARGLNALETYDG